MKHMPGRVEVWEETITLPTYGVGKPDRNPMFLEKRVYQGSSGKVYPLPVIDKIEDEKQDQDYRGLWLENDYLRVLILPELGGRIQRAYDKTNDYDFVYYNEVIKPALVGLVGPWISGGIEFNWPQHHRPSTYMPTDYLLTENVDGSKTVQINEIDRMYGTKAIASFTLYPDRAYVEIKGQLYNRTALPQTFLWWANPAVAVNDDTQSIFPPDVHAVMDHGKRAVSRFPIATGVYYKHDYGEGVDISRYKNIPVPTSYMAFHSNANFVGGYDYGVEAGVLHIADHHVSPGKKQWTWGSGDFGKAWDRNLTDENGPYIELMTGMYTDNQPDFTWLKPYEEKTFTQFFMPYKKVGSVKNASTEAVLGLEETQEGVRVCVYTTAEYANAHVSLRCGDETLLDWEGTLSPTSVLCRIVEMNRHPLTALRLSVADQNGRVMLSYQPEKEEVVPQPAPAKAALMPEQVLTNEELLLTGLHLEQYRHATYEPEAYYQEGLKRDPLDSRINNAYGMLLMRRGEFDKGEACFRNAIKRLTERNPNPYDGEAYNNLGLCLKYQGRQDEAFDAFYKATWTSAQQEMGFYELAAIAAARGDNAEALALNEKALVKNSHNIKARGLKLLLLKRLGFARQADSWTAENLKVDAFDYVTRLLAENLDPSEATLELMRNLPETFLSVARDFAWWGCYQEALNVVELCDGGYPLLAYYQAYYQSRLGQSFAASLTKAASLDPLYCFPNALEDIAVLRFAVKQAQTDGKAPYYLGNLLYDRKRYDEAQALWERSAALDGTFPTVRRNLSLAYYNKSNEPEKALEVLSSAYALDPSDARVLLELDQLHRKLGRTPAQRYAFLDAHKETVLTRDDLTVEYITLLNLLDRPHEAYDMMMNRHFHPWEGGEGKITSQYTLALLQMAKTDMANGSMPAAEKKLLTALSFPENLGEGKLEGAKDNNLYYYLGVVCEAQNRSEEARQYWLKAVQGDTEPAGMMYYNDQPADLILYQGLAYQKLGCGREARTRFNKLVDYGETHLFDTVRIEYFAVSLPDLQLFDDNLDRRNQAHCQYLIALGSYGLGDHQSALSAYERTLEIDPAHMGAHIHRMLLA